MQKKKLLLLLSCMYVCFSLLLVLLFVESLPVSPLKCVLEVNKSSYLPGIADCVSLYTRFVFPVMFVTLLLVVIIAMMVMVIMMTIATMTTTMMLMITALDAAAAFGGAAAADDDHDIK